MGETTSGVRRARMSVNVEPDFDQELDPVEIERAEIARTRNEMGGTIDEIQTRLTPGYVAEQAAGTVVDMASGVRSRMAGAVRSNPVPAVITAAGLGYLLYRAFTSSDHRNGSMDGYEDGGHMAGPSKIDDIVDATSEKVSMTKAKVADSAQAGISKAQDVARTAGERTSRTADTLKRVISENPAAAVVVAVGVGAAAGMALPKSEVEERYLGSTGEELVDRARGTVEELGDRTKRAAQRAGDAARQEMASDA